LNGEKVHKTKTVKKKLNPAFDEKFTTPIHKLKGDLRVEVFDWNQVNQDKRLGSGVVDLAQLEPGMGILQQVQLNNGNSGYIALQLLFHPMFISKMTHRASTSLTQMVNPLHQARTVGTIAGSAARGGVRTVSTIGGVAGGAVKSVFGFGKRHSSSRSSLSSVKTPSYSNNNMPSDEPLDTPAEVNVPANETGNLLANDANSVSGSSPAAPASSEGLAVPMAVGVSNMDKNTSNRGHMSAISDQASVYSVEPSGPNLSINEGDATGVPGTLVITIIAAENLKAVDSSGK
jgi:hypothetical protein